MNQGRTVFSQIMEYVSHNEFNRCVQRYHSNKSVRRFTCWDQFLVMAFAQLTYRESLRDITVCLNAQQRKLYHLGLSHAVKRSTLAEANEHRDWRIYADLAHSLIDIARPLYANTDIGLEIETAVYALDSTTIDLCLSLFPWAKFRKTKAAIKLHTLIDIHGSCFHRYYPREMPRFECSGQSPRSTRSIHRYGQRLYRFRPSLCSAPVACLLCHPRKRESQIQTAIIASD